VASRYGLPSRRKGGVWTYCVRGGGKFIAVFSKGKRLLFLATTAKGYKRGKLHPGSLLRTLRRSYRGRSLRTVRGQVIVVRKGKANRNLVFGVRGRRIRYIAVVDRSILRKPSLLIKFHKRAGFATAKKKHKRKR
jgi:hypothetical protein